MDKKTKFVLNEFVFQVRLYEHIINKKQCAAVTPIVVEWKRRHEWFIGILRVGWRLLPNFFSDDAYAVSIMVWRSDRGEVGGWLNLLWGNLVLIYDPTDWSGLLFAGRWSIPRDIN